MTAPDYVPPSPVSFEGPVDPLCEVTNTFPSSPAPSSTLSNAPKRASPLLSSAGTDLSPIPGASDLLPLIQGLFGAAQKQRTLRELASYAISANTSTVSRSQQSARNRKRWEEAVHQVLLDRPQLFKRMARGRWARVSDESDDETEDEDWVAITAEGLIARGSGNSNSLHVLLDAAFSVNKGPEPVFHPWIMDFQTQDADVAATALVLLGAPPSPPASPSASSMDSLLRAVELSGYLAPQD